MKDVFVHLTPTVQRRVLVNTPKCSFSHMKVARGTNTPAHRHPHATILYMVKGYCNLRLGEELVFVSPDEAVYIDSDVLHGFVENEEDLEFFEFFTPGREDF